jgi:hypothetical protein
MSDSARWYQQQGYQRHQDREEHAEPNAAGHFYEE